MASSMWKRALRNLGQKVAAFHLDPEGELRADAHPMARQLAVDIEAMMALDGAERLQNTGWDGDMRELFLNEEIAEEFNEVDVPAIRAAYLRRAVPPPGCTAEELPPTDSTEEEGAQVFVCGLKTQTWSHMHHGVEDGASSMCTSERGIRR